MGPTQPVALTGDVKRIAPITLRAIVPALVDAGLATAEAIESTAAELDRIAQSDDVLVATPRVVQMIARRPRRHHYRTGYSPAVRLP